MVASTKIKIIGVDNLTARELQAISTAFAQVGYASSIFPEPDGIRGMSFSARELKIMQQGFDAHKEVLITAVLPAVFWGIKIKGSTHMNNTAEVRDGPEE